MFIDFYIERKGRKDGGMREREGKRERETSALISRLLYEPWLVGTLTGDQIHNLDLCPDWGI